MCCGCAFRCCQCCCQFCCFRCRCGFCNAFLRKICFYGLGILLPIVGLVLHLTWPDWTHSFVHNRLIIKEGTRFYDNWVENPATIYRSFYLFNWTNPEEIRNPQIKPTFVEMGPYVFREKRLKKNIKFHSNHTVSYNERITWFFDKNKSKGNLRDIVTSAHVITAAVADNNRDHTNYEKNITNLMLNYEGGNLTASKPAGDWILYGFQDKLIDLLRFFNTTITPYSKFGWFVDRNNSLGHDGSFTVYTGEGDISKLGQLTHWNRQSQTGFYPAPCGTVNGSVGGIFPPHMDTEGVITVFAIEACRFMNLKPKGTVNMHGLNATVWVATEETLDSASNDIRQQCFCRANNKICPKTGVIDCKKCRDDAPIYASFPHFYLADEHYRNSVDGMKPDAEKHQYRLVVDPKTGIPLQVNERLQINMMMTPDPEFDIYRDVKEFLLPLFWFEQSMSTTKDNVYKPILAQLLLDYGYYAGMALAVLGGILLLFGFISSIIACFKSSGPSPLIEIPANSRGVVSGDSEHPTLYYQPTIKDLKAIRRAVR